MKWEGSNVPTWGDHGQQGAVAFSFDNMGEAADVEFGIWPDDQRLGFHFSIYETLPFLLDTLKEYGLRSTFFVEAWNADHYPDAVRAIMGEGHEIGYHGYQHELSYRMSDERQIEVLKRAQESYERIGARPVGFRPPGGVSMAASERYVKSIGYTYSSPVGGKPGIRNGLAVIPSEMSGTDVSYYSPILKKCRHPKSGAATNEQAFVAGFKAMLDDLAEGGDCRSPVCHVTTPLDTPARKDAFRQVVEMSVADDRLWKPTLAEAAEWILANPQIFPTEERLRGCEADWDPSSFSYEDAAEDVFAKA